jgi:predicted MFS family arabinose efflux permease
MSCFMMGLLMVVAFIFLPQRNPIVSTHSPKNYVSLLTSMMKLALSNRPLQKRAMLHALMFASFSLFWTIVPLVLMGPAFGLTQVGVGLFAFLGVTGSVAAPIAGSVADRGWTKWATLAALLCAAISFLLTLCLPLGGLWSLGLFVVAAVLLDAGVSANLILGQRVIFTQSADIRSRLNGLYMTTFFLGGAVGSALGGWVYAHQGWTGCAIWGTVFPAIALGLHLVDMRQSNSGK